MMMPDVRPIDKVALVAHLRQVTAELEEIAEEAEKAGRDSAAESLLQYVKVLVLVMKDIIGFRTLDDYAPIRHGEWKLFGEKPITIRVDEWVVCSECNRDFMRFTGIWFNFCPYCGAKMDGGKSDEKG